MPTIPDIKISIENKDIFVKDEYVRKGTFLRSGNGELIMYTGGFTAVFPVLIENEKWAFRCWHTELGNVTRRFRTITKNIQAAKVSYLCDFAYEDEGLLVEGKLYPTTRMQWVEGLTIKDYICKYSADKSKLKILASNFLTLVQDMHRRDFAHGDLQHGNIMVDQNSKLFLVDYDSFYCPELKGESDIITGIADYQHPSRKQNLLANEKMDYFSELIIYLSILAVAEVPDLVAKYKIEESDRLLFSATDYANLHQSDVYKDISTLTPEIGKLCQILDEYLDCSEISELEPFDVCLDQMNLYFNLSKERIKQNIENAELTWEAKETSNISIYEGDKVLIEKGKKKGGVSVRPTQTTTYKLLCELKNGKKVCKEITLWVFPESEVTFCSDKNYVFPSIPFKLTWDVKNAIKVELDGTAVEHVGSKVVEEGVVQETQYVLQVTDNFGTLKYPVAIKMLPVPVIHINTTPPAITTVVNVSAKLNVPNIHVSLPSTPLKSVSLTVNMPNEIHCVRLKDDASLFRKWFQVYSIVAKIKSIIKKSSQNHD